MHTITANTETNRLYIVLNGSFSADELKVVTDEVIEAAKKMAPGYDVVTDISQFKVASQDATAEIERAQKYFVDSGARRGVRVVGSHVIPGMQFQRTGTEAHFVSTNVKTIEEAELLLDTK
jgi:hypothetical protein